MTASTGEAKGLGEQKLLLFTLLMVAFNMRGAVTGVGALEASIKGDTGMSGTAFGMITTLLVVAFGLVSFIAPGLGKRYGFERAMLGALVVLVGGIFVRSVGLLAFLFIGSFLVGAGIAVLNVLVPALVRRDFAGHMGVFMGIYSAILGLTAGLGAGLAVPVMNMLGGSWRLSLALWILPGVVGGLLWAPYAMRHITRPAEPSHTQPGMESKRSVWRSKLAWSITAFMGLQSLYFYTLAAWMPTIFKDRGMSPVDAGYLMLLFQVVSVVMSLVAPYLAAKMKDQVMLGTGIGAICVLGSLVLLVPGTKLAWLWVSIMGLGTGGCLSLAMVLLGLRSRTAATASELSGMTQAIGYLIAGLGPVIFGALHDLTDGWAVPIIALAVTMVVMTWFARLAGVARVVDEA
jgi:MFS transporter, CP family, cyanate transporter